MQTVKDTCKRGYCLPGKQSYFINDESERRIGARLIDWHGIGWYSYDGSMYRFGKQAAYSQIAIQPGRAGSGGVVEHSY